MSFEQALLESRLERYRHFDELNRRYVDWQLDLLRPFLGERILEVGCGVGSVLDLLAPRVLLGGVDLEEEMVRHAAERFRGRGDFVFSRMDIAAPPPQELARLAALRFDTVVSINVLEHIEDDVAALVTMASLLDGGGHVCLLVPAHPALYGAYDAVDGHVRRYTRRGLASVIARAGLDCVLLKRFNAVGAVGWWWQYKVLKRSIHGAAQFGLMSRLVPVCRWLERMVPPPFGLSLAAVCRKPA